MRQVSTGCYTQSHGIEHPPLIFVKPNGTVAWLQEEYFVTHGGNPPPPCTKETYIYAVGTDGFHRIAALDSSSPEKIELRGSTLVRTVRHQTDNALLR